MRKDISMMQSRDSIHARGSTMRTLLGTSSVKLAVWNGDPVPVRLSFVRIWPVVLLTLAGE